MDSERKTWDIHDGELATTNIPGVSIVLTTLNSEHLIDRCMRSIVWQSSCDWDLVVVDGASRDGTLRRLEDYKTHIHHLTSEKDKGIYDAWNKARPFLRREWTYFIGADDYLPSPSVMAQVLDSLATLPPDTLLAYASVRTVDHYGRQVGIFGVPWEKFAKRFSSHRSLPMQGVFIRTSYLQQHGFDDGFRIAGDYDFTYRCIQKRAPRFIGPVVVCHMQVGGISSRPENALELLRECQTARRKQGRPPNSWRLRLAILRARWLVFWGRIPSRQSRQR